MGKANKSSASVPWAIAATGLVLAIRLTPKGGRDAIDGIEALSDGRSVLKARVRAAPTDGAANAALISLLAKTLDVPRRTVTLASGETARIKRVVIDGGGAALAAKLQHLLDSK
ncbi:DUF167 family protein [Pseudorhodoplanes sp.]|uniref:DUF167 family protein n=1 Tax=Pseudorhodoplanes sp. TaxID=1934341 RepID=UPI003919858D